MTREQAALWPADVQTPDATPLEAGGAIVVLRLTPDELRYLRLFADTDITRALHDLIEEAIRRDGQGST